MVGPAIALEYFILFIFFGFLIFLLFYAISNKSTLRKSIPAGLLFLVLFSFSVFAYVNYLNEKKEASKKFLGDYKLNRLDKKGCINCKLKLKNDFSYDKIVNQKIIGHGKWGIEDAMDIPDYYLEIENGPNYVILESNRTVEYIDRGKNN